MAVAFKLYELSDAMNQVADMIEDGIEGLEDTIESLDASFQDKVESIIRLARSKEAEAAIIKEEMERLQKRMNKQKKSAEWLYMYVENSMKQANVTEVKSPLFSIKLGMTPPRVVVSNEFDIPEKYMRIVPSTKAPDKKAIKEAIESGETVPGCELRQDLKIKVR